MSQTCSGGPDFPQHGPAAPTLHLAARCGAERNCIGGPSEDEEKPLESVAGKVLAGRRRWQQRIGQDLDVGRKMSGCAAHVGNAWRQTRWNSSLKIHPMRYVDSPLSPSTSRVLSSAGLSWASRAPPPETERSHWALGRRVLPGRGDAKGSPTPLDFASAQFRLNPWALDAAASAQLSPKPVPDPWAADLLPLPRTVSIVSRRSSSERDVRLAACGDQRDAEPVSELGHPSMLSELVSS